MLLCTDLELLQNEPSTPWTKHWLVLTKECLSEEVQFPSPGRLKLDTAADLNSSAQGCLYKGQLLLVQVCHSFLFSGGTDYVFKFSFLQ